jgi:CDP-glucose 4,6-dehydratase
MAALWGADARWQADAGTHPHEARQLKLDISKARSRLNWHPALRLPQALQLITDWARQRQGGADMQALTLQQIRAYQTSIPN